MSTLRSYILLIFFTGISFVYGEPNQFNKEKDLFIAQFDCIPDSDDVHSQAAVGCLLAHPDFKGVNYFAVAGAYGVQVRNKKFKYIDTEELMNVAFGTEALPAMNEQERLKARWVNAHGEISYEKDEEGRPIHSAERLKNLTFAKKVVLERVRPILEKGGRVFIMEAGQSDFTADWVEELLKGGVKSPENIILVQHSFWNEKHTSGHKWTYADKSNDWAFINNPVNLRYVQIDDGNQPYESDNKDRGPYSTPGYLSDNKEFLKSATSSENLNEKTRKLWTIAERIALDSPYDGKVIRGGGVDFSDTVEAMWIFDLAEEEDGYTTVETFWKGYVLNSELEQ